MKIDKILLYINRGGRVGESDIRAIEQKLDSLGIAHSREFPGSCADGFDAIISLGGDGTMLSAAHIAIERDIPLMGINFGTLGYMSALESGEIELLAALKDDPATEERMLLEVSLERGGRMIAGYTALNEAMIGRDPRSGISRFELYCDGAKVCDYRSDGVIVATPTGSSAYSLSAGGPIIDTKLDAFCVTPICSHALGSRSMVFSPNSVLTIVNAGPDGADSLVSDGSPISELETGDRVIVRRSSKTLKLLTLKKDAFYEVLYRKMI